jgi:hypothetical protein
MDLRDALTTIATCGGAGAFIDWWIGQNGDRRVRSWLETWWLRFSYVRLGNFGQAEALFAVTVMDRLFGPWLFSIRRLASVLVIQALGIGWLVLRPHAVPDSNSPDYYQLLWSMPGMPLFVSLFYVQASAGLAVSISVARAAAIKAASWCGDSQIRNFACFVSLFFVQYVILVIWRPFVMTPFSILIPAVGFLLPLLNGSELVHLGHNDVMQLWETIKAPVVELLIHRRVDFYLTGTVSAFLSYFTIPLPHMHTWVVPMHACILSGYAVSLSRLFVAAVFVVSYLLRPLQPPIAALWARIVESDKPVFTLLFGGTAAVAKTIEEIIHNLCRC